MRLIRNRGLDRGNRDCQKAKMAQLGDVGSSHVGLLQEAEETVYPPFLPHLEYTSSLSHKIKSVVVFYHRINLSMSEE